MSIIGRLARLLGGEARVTNIEAGHAAPGFSLTGLDGKKQSLSGLLERGPAVVAFFKISCPVCQFTMPFLQRMFERYAGTNVSIVGVSQDDARHTTDFNKEYGVTFPTLLDDEKYSASNAYGLTSVPTIFLIAPDGKVEVSCMGFVRSDLETIAAKLAEYRQAKVVPLFRADEVVPAYKPG